ncbi:MAG: hypothetical protein P0116_13655 [Candidatus Nitrosocosmicus sp.]|nr:hypothetical protein [Candidatus Nitrosocosmicus sp.]
MDNVLIPTSLTDDQMNDLISDLQILIRQPSISATNQGLEECSILLSNMMKNAGIQTELLYLDLEEQVESRTMGQIPPVVYGGVKSKSNPSGKTILFYNHYDVAVSRSN